MANILKVTPQEVIDKAGQIESTKVEMENTLSDIITLINTMNEGDWIGAAGTAYKTQFDVLVNQVKAGLARIETHTANLREAAQTYSEREAEIESSANKLDASGIF